MICQFKRLIYPRSQPVEDGSYMIALYKPCESIRDSAGNMVSEVKAVACPLPITSAMISRGVGAEMPSTESSLK